MHTLSAIEIKDKVLSGNLSAADVTSLFLARIEKYDPQIQGFLRVFKEQALADAKKVDEKRASGKKLGKLAGIPIALKDNIHLKGQLSTCGSRFLENYRAPFDSTVAKLLKQEDAVIIGKTNMDEFAMGSSTENSAFQRTYNPWHLECTPGGSSGGSAAVVAARLAPIALGSDTGGSIRQPASLCGIVGFKPTYGRVSRYGLVAYGSSLDQIGPFAASAKDAALIMEVIGRHCENDSTSLFEAPENYLDTFDGNIKGMKIGVPWQFLESLAPESKDIFTKSIETIQSLGAKIVEVDLAILKHSIATYYILATAEASTNLARFDGIRFGKRSSRATTLDEVYEFSKEEGFGSEVKRRILLGTFVLSSGYHDAYYKKAQMVRTLMIRRFNEVFKSCDLVAMPASPFGAFKIGEIQDPLQMYLQDIYTISSNLAGLPAVSVPSGFTKEGKPVGIQMIGPQKADKKVLFTADAFEKAAGVSEMIPDLFKA